MRHLRPALSAWSLLLACSDAGGASPTHDAAPADQSSDGGSDAALDDELTPSEIVPECGGDYMSISGAACAIRNDSCEPADVGCCRCKEAHRCDHPLQWVCTNSHPDCPDEPPKIGATCEIGQYSTCLWCSVPAIERTCVDGIWQEVQPEVYCAG